MKRMLVLALAASVVTVGVTAPAASTKTKRCPKGTKLVKRKCKKIKKASPNASKSVKTVSGVSNGSSFTIVPNAKARTATVTVTITCKSADGQSVIQSNAPGETVPLSATVNLQQSFKGGVSNDKEGTAMTWQITGLWKTDARYEGVVSGTASQPGGDSFTTGCMLPPTNVVLR